MDIKVQNKIIEIANAFRPNLNRPVFMENNRLEWIDLLKCAILKKEEEEKLLKELLDSIELAKVCKNKLYPKNRGHKRENDLGNGEIYYEDERQYYVIESALCDEDELEQLLLYKIKIDE